MKKVLCVLLSLVMAFSFVFVATAAGEEEKEALKFNEDGTFKILQFNDTQDVGLGANSKLVKFIEKALDLEKPDLVVFVGDQLSDFYPFGTKEDMKKSINNIIAPLAERNIPFLVTLGNHDYDHFSIFSKAEQAEAYASLGNCYNADDGWDEFTVNAPILSSDGNSIAMNIFMMNTHKKAETGGYSGVIAEQNVWYEKVSAELKAANGGKDVPSMLFQHIPPKEIYSLLEICEWNEEGAVYSQNDGNWYKLDETKAEGYLGEAPCSENFDNITGQYQSWVKTGNIMGAFFAHDHVNNFVGTTDEGIVMGYNSGTGFRAYGLGSERSARVFEFNEEDVENYETRTLTYKEATGDETVVTISDAFAPTLLTYIMKVVYFFFGPLIKLFS